MDLPAPMLPVAGPLPTGPGWVFEFKWDGVRIIAGLGDGRLELRTRHGNEISERFPELAGFADRIGDAVLDGELVVLAGQVPDWAAAIRRLRARPAAARQLATAHLATVMLFDVLRLDGADLRSRPYEERRGLLEELPLAAGWTVPPTADDAAAAMEVSRRHGLEGVVAKRRSSRYTSGRSRQWVKTRHRTVVDVVVVGWVPTAAGGCSLLLAEDTPSGLAYRGRCTAPADVLEALEPLATAAPPVTVPGGPAKDVRWVRPVLGAEVDAASRRPDERLRHPRLLRVRLDQVT